MGTHWRITATHWQAIQAIAAAIAAAVAIASAVVAIRTADPDRAGRIEAAAAGNAAAIEQLRQRIWRLESSRPRRPGRE